MSVFRGITLIISDGLPVRGLNSNFLNFMNSMNKSIPIPVIILFLLAAVLAFVIKFTSYGQYVFAVGGNEEATRFACVNIVAVKTITYAISGLASSLAAIIYMGRLAAADPQAGASYEMNAIAAAAIGGASLAGGRGSLVGTIIGVIILGTLSNGLTLLNVQSFYQTLFVGLIILAAATIDHFSNK
jgi:ribose transport system permease protein